MEPEYLPFPVVENLTPDLIDRWCTFYASDPDEFPRTSEEGLWRRTQCYETRGHSGWKSLEDNRRRMIHYKHHFELVSDPDGTVDLALVETYLWLHLCLPNREVDEYIRLIKKGLSEGKWKSVAHETAEFNQYATFRKGEFIYTLSSFKEHEQDKLVGRVFPDGYRVLEVEFISAGCRLEDDFDTYPWVILNSGIRKPNVRGNPTEITDDSVEEIIEFFPAQVELGCGPSTEAGIPPLNFLHKVYCVTNTETHKTIYGTREDRLAYRIASNLGEVLKDFSVMFKSCFLANPTDFYYILKRCHDHGLVVGDIISHNFDGLPTRLGLKEVCDRRYDTPFNYSVSFHPDAKSLLVVGCHADRRRVQAAARERGLKIVYTDPEGFLAENGFEPYPLESPQDGDLLYSQKADVAFQHIERKLIEMGQLPPRGDSVEISEGEMRALSGIRRKKMSSYEGLLKSIQEKKARVVVIGLGYVGISVSARLAQVGFQVAGLDIDETKVAKVNQGIFPIGGDEPGLLELLEEVVKSGNLRASTDYVVCRQADIVLVIVESPVDSNHIPRYAALRSALHSLNPNLKQGALVIVESTIAPGTIDRVVRPILENNGQREVGTDFYLVHCPERVRPGVLLENLQTMSRVIGGCTPESAELARALYSHFVQSELDTTDAVTAELVKTGENAFRDVQIAFANELALICEQVGADVWQVRQLINKSPGRNVLLPGAGVGGHCIPKDPWLLAYGAGGVSTIRLIPAARAVNDSMPLHVADLTVDALTETGARVQEARLVVLGYAYREDSDDTRNSPTGVLVAKLNGLGADVVVHDPWVPEYQADLFRCAQGCDAAVVMVGHKVYRELDLAALKSALRAPVLVDGRRVFEPKQAQEAGFVYRCVGQGW